MQPHTAMAQDGNGMSFTQELFHSDRPHQKGRELLLTEMEEPMQPFVQDQREPQPGSLPIHNPAARKQRYVVMGLMFFPRGGSAHVTRSLARELVELGWKVTIVCGSLRIPGRPGDAQAFFAGLDVHPVDYTASLATEDPLRADTPMHPSYEDRPGALDRVFARVDDETYEHLVATWMRALRSAGAAEADILHLNHLTPLNEAAARLAPHTPVVGHIHGTELLMLEAIEQGPPPNWEYAEAWAKRMRRWASTCQRLVMLSDTQLKRMMHLLLIDPERCVFIPNGFDPRHFDRSLVDRSALWRQLLVEHPLGWHPHGEPGSVSYRAEELSSFAEGPVLLYVGRFTAIKRIRLLISAYARARASFQKRAPLVLVGGFPGEWEDEHPFVTIERTGARDVFLAGWHGHEELPDIFAASDVIILPSVREQFGQVLVEGMACGLPAIAVNTYGPSEIVDDGQTGWLVPPDDEHALTAALVQAVNNDAERLRRGAAAYTAVRARYSWPALGARLAHTYKEVLDKAIIS
jgi:glycosyltransferase involved in cell wall biosynthesis